MSWAETGHAPQQKETARNKRQRRSHRARLCMLDLAYRFRKPFARAGVGASGARVGLVVTVAQPLGRNVGVNLGSAETAVAEQLLDAADVGACVQEVGRKAVSQRVGAGARVQAG